MMMGLPVIAIVGRANVGKSTLFNRLSHSRRALVSDFAGLTRDRQYANITLDDNLPCTLIDTGGLTAEDNLIDNSIATQVTKALTESDLIYFVLNSQDGITNLDFAIVKQLRKLTKKIIVICNKAEGKDQSIAAEFFELGLGQPLLISATHGLGIDELIAKTILLLPPQTAAVADKVKPSASIAVAVMGRPNVGKSTLINCILGDERLLAMDLPGTTRDSIYIPFERDQQQYTLIDTAGIRRKSSVNHKIEKFSIMKAIETVERANVVLLILDASEGVTKQDATLLGIINDRGRALLIVINKWDGLGDYQKQQTKRLLENKLSFINYSSVHYISALHGSGVGKLFAPINKAYNSAGAQFATSLLNTILAKANQQHKPPPIKGRRLRIKYINQINTFPPTFALHGNNLNDIPSAYQSFLRNFFIKSLNLTNTTVHFEYKIAKNPFKDKRNTLTTRQTTKKQRLLKFSKH